MYYLIEYIHRNIPSDTGTLHPTLVGFTVAAQFKSSVHAHWFAIAEMQRCDRMLQVLDETEFAALQDKLC